MILKLDEKQIPITNFYETLVERAQMTATNGTQEIPLIGTYHKAEAVNASYDARSKIYTVNIVLTGGEAG